MLISNNVKLLKKINNLLYRLARAMQKKFPLHLIRKFSQNTFENRCLRD